MDAIAHANTVALRLSTSLVSSGHTARVAIRVIWPRGGDISIERPAEEFLQSGAVNPVLVLSFGEAK